MGARWGRRPGRLSRAALERGRGSLCSVCLWPCARERLAGRTPWWPRPGGQSVGHWLVTASAKQPGSGLGLRRPALGRPARPAVGVAHLHRLPQRQLRSGSQCFRGAGCEPGFIPGAGDVGAEGGEAPAVLAAAGRAVRRHGRRCSERRGRAQNSGWDAGCVRHGVPGEPGAGRQQGSG